MAILGAVVGGGGVTMVARLALTESLRKVFADKEDVVTPLDMHEKIVDHGKSTEERLATFSAAIRTEFETKFGSTAGRLEREHASLSADLQRAIGALDQASRSLREEGLNSAEAVKQAALAKKEVEGLTELYKALSIRIGHLEEAASGFAKGLSKLQETAGTLEEQLRDVLNYQIAEERRRTGGR